MRDLIEKAIPKLPCTSVSKRVLMENISYEKYAELISIASTLREWQIHQAKQHANTIYF